MAGRQCAEVREHAEINDDRLSRAHGRAGNEADTAGSTHTTVASEANSVA